MDPSGETVAVPLAVAAAEAQQAAQRMFMAQDMAPPFHGEAPSPPPPVGSGTGSPTPQEQSVICVFNLPHTTQDDQLRAFFEKYGNVEKIFTIREKQRGCSRCKGYAFVYFGDPVSAARAKDQANGEKFQGRSIRVDYSTTAKRDTPPAPPSTVLCVFGLPGEVAVEEIRAAFGRHAPAVARVNLVKERLTGRCRGYGFVYFHDTTSARQAKEDTPVLMIRGHMARVDFSLTTEPRDDRTSCTASTSFSRGARPCNVLGVFGLPRETDDDDIRDLFAPFGQVLKVDLVSDKASGQCKGYAFAYFESIEAAAQAYEHCTRGPGYTPAVRGQVVRVDYSLTTAPPQTRQQDAQPDGAWVGGLTSPVSPLSLPNDSFASATLQHQLGLAPPTPPTAPGVVPVDRKQRARGRANRRPSGAAAGHPELPVDPPTPPKSGIPEQPPPPDVESLDLVSRLQVLTESPLQPELEQLFPLPRTQLMNGKWSEDYVKGYEESRLDMLRLLDGYLRTARLQWGPASQSMMRPAPQPDLSVLVKQDMPVMEFDNSGCMPEFGLEAVASSTL